MFLSVIGLCEVIHFLTLILFDTKSCRNKVVCCLLKGRTADIELQFVVEQFKWMGRKYADRIIAIYSLDIKKDVLNRCEEIALKNGVEIIASNEVCENIFFEDVNEQ